jgi:hypothetical protein
MNHYQNVIQFTKIHKTFFQINVHFWKKNLHFIVYAIESTVVSCLSTQLEPTRFVRT